MWMFFSKEITLMFSRLLLLITLAGACLLPASAHADWINLTGAETSPNIAEIYVMDDHVRVVLEAYVDDLDVFEDLVPNDWVRELDVERPDSAARMRRFSDQVLQVVTPGGERLQAQLKLVEPRQRIDRKSPFAGMINPYTRQRVPQAPTDKRVLYAEIIYPFTGRPSALTFIPPQDDEGRAQVSIGFIVYHKSVPVIDFRYLGAPATLELDWADPWYSKFDNPNLKRHHKSALMSFLYVEDYEVRHEVLTRVKDMASWMDLGLRGDEYIELDELDALRQRIGEFLLTRNAVLIDAEPVKPILDRTSFVKVSINGIQLLEQPERLEISTAIVGVIITYLVDGLPQQVTVDWDLFNDQIQRVPATSTDPAGPLPTFLTPEDNVHSWTNFLKNYTPSTVANVNVSDTAGVLALPLASLLCALLLVPALVWLWRRRGRGESQAAAVTTCLILLVAAVLLYPHGRMEVKRPTAMLRDLDPQQASAILNSLLQNVYRAFDFRDESDVYDKLAISVQGDLLTDIYLQNRKSFAVQKAGGAQARVNEVEVLSATARPAADTSGAFVLDATWTAQGSVGHWGHVHTRKNYYDAAVTVAVVDGAWKITALELLEERRVEPGVPVKGAEK
jgi:hypothetical protein